MGSFEGSAAAMGPEGLMGMLTVLAGTDGLVAGLFGSIGNLIGVGGGAA